MRSIAALALLFANGSVHADDAADVKKALEAPILTPRQTLLELQEYLDAKIPRLPEPTTAEAWEKETARLQKEVLEKVVFRGEAATWRNAKCGVVFSDGYAAEGYSVKKVRFEIIPGFWVPALLYVPDKVEGKVPVMLAVNGHDRAGKAAGYKQTRCINLAKRGMIVLNVEWLGMGQLNLPANAHGTMDQLNLCGTSGLSLFYLNMTRGMDVLLGHPNADPKRVAVSGLSGGGWQTITVSGLDPRVTLSNPVAGYSSFRTRIQHFKDLGDSEQTPCDLATLVDYTHLTAMRAPRPTLLTFNAKDNCCFESGYALPPLERASRPVFKLFGKEDSLRTHVNHVPGDHNFGQENREALYQMIGDHFFPTDKAWSSKEVLCEKELKTPTELNVELPKDNLTINAVALKLAEKLPRAAEGESVAARRAALAEILRLPKLTAKLEKEKSTLGSVYRVGPWSVPGVEFVKPLGAKRTTIVIADAGKKSVADQVAELRKGDTHVLALDLYYFGECHPASHDWLWSLMLATVGDRALGLQVSQLNAIATLVGGNVTVVAVGPRTSTIALAAAVVDEKAIAALELHEPHRSLREILVENRVVAKTPELFCFGLLERFDVAGLTALVAPRPVKTLDRPKK